MFTMKFQKSKVGGLPAFQLSMPDTSLILQAVAADKDKADWVVDRILRNVNNSVKLIDYAGKDQTVESVLGLIAEGMVVSNGTTYTADDFQSEWVKGLAEFVSTNPKVAEDKVAAVKELLAKAVRHGGKTQLSTKQCEAILALFGESANDHDILATAAANAKWKLEEDKKADNALDFLA